VNLLRRARKNRHLQRIRSELERLKQTVDTLVAWQSAVQEYLQTSIEAENIRTVAQQLASLGVILPDEQIQEIARTSQQLGIPPSVLLKAKAYDYTMQTMRQQGQVPYPFMVNAPSADVYAVSIVPIVLDTECASVPSRRTAHTTHGLYKVRRVLATDGHI
jgi:hypothetical protein